MDQPTPRCRTPECTNFAGTDGQCNACRRGEKPDPEKRKREEESAKAAEEREREAKKRKCEENRASRPACEGCGRHEILTLYNKAPDNNYYTLPSGREVEGSMLPLPGLTHHEGIDMHICISCGAIVGLDVVALQDAVREAEAAAREE